MKICYLCSDLGIPLNGHKGGSAHVRGFIRALKLLGHDVAVVTSSDNGDCGLDAPVFSIPKPRFFEALPMDTHPRLTRALGHVCNNCGTEEALREVIESFKPELIYERYSPFAVSGSILAKERKIPHILEVNALLAEEGKTYRKQALQEASEVLENIAFNSSSFIVTVTRELRESLIDLGIPSTKVMDVQNGVDEIFFRPVEDSIRKDFRDKIVIGFLGSLKPWHGIDMLIDSFRILVDEAVYHLMIVGDGPMMKKLRPLEKEFPGRVTLTGNINHNDVPKYVHAMDIALAPYPKLEKFYFSPLKLLEYMALGRAIIATDIGGIKNLIRHGETGWLVSSTEPQGFIKAIQRLSKDKGLREKLGSKAKEEARLYHTWRHRAAFILDHYQNRRSCA